MLDTLTLARFAPLVGETFRLHASADRVIETTLVEARSLASKMPVTEAAPARDGAAPREPFSLVFKGPAAPVLPQRIYRIEHGTLGPQELFIVPIGLRDGGVLYEAIFT